jgi:hypothetical protein
VTTSKTFVCIASGHGTFRVRDELKSWGFSWHPDTKTWRASCVTEGERRMYEYQVLSGEWKEVRLQFGEESREPWEDQMDRDMAAVGGPVPEETQGEIE